MHQLRVMLTVPGFLSVWWATLDACRCPWQAAMRHRVTAHAIVSQEWRRAFSVILCFSFHDSMRPVLVKPAKLWRFMNWQKLLVCFTNKYCLWLILSIEMPLFCLKMSPIGWDCLWINELLLNYNFRACKTSSLQYITIYYVFCFFFSFFLFSLSFLYCPKQKRKKQMFINLFPHFNLLNWTKQKKKPYFLIYNLQHEYIIIREKGKKEKSLKMLD